MALDLSKILSVSAEAYAQSVEKKLNNYHLYGVHTIIRDSDITGKLGLNKFIEDCPTNTEVVVDYDMNSRVHHYLILYGTALIPKKK